MAIKHALIVDDSKSARLVLKRLLNDLDIEVDTVESAPDAIEYLEEHTPDVVFMDHMMPGMDGFEAVKEIKKNDKTAAIPIMMYTSRGGDVYLSQARELGAVGIIPKTVSPVKLKESLFKLGLVKDRRVNSTLQVEDNKIVELKIDEKPLSEEEKTKLEAGLLKKQRDHDSYIDDLRKLMDDQTIELHKSMWLGIESVSHEIFNRLNSELEERFDKLQSGEQPEASGVVPLLDHRIGWPVVIVVTLLIASIILNITLLSNLHNHEPVAIEQVEPETIQLQANAAGTNAAGVRIAAQQEKDRSSTDEFISWAQNLEIEYPYDELALNENRLPGIEELIRKATKANYQGRIELQTHVGRFCLSRDTGGNYQLAKDELSITECDYIGNPVQPYDVASTHQSLGFANYLSDLGSLSDRGIEIDVSNVSRNAELSKYPRQNQQTKVEEWNLAARLNNRITVMLTPRPLASEHGSGDGLY